MIFTTERDERRDIAEGGGYIANRKAAPRQIQKLWHTKTNSKSNTNVQSKQISFSLKKKQSFTDTDFKIDAAAVEHASQHL